MKRVYTDLKDTLFECTSKIIQSCFIIFIETRETINSKKK